MSSDVYYSAFLEHQDAVGQAHCAQAVRDDDGSVILLQFNEVALDTVFLKGVDGGRRLV